jgi:hypothetical protein
MPAVALLASLRRAGATVSLTLENRVRVAAPPGVLDHVLRAAIRAHREGLLALLRLEGIPCIQDRKLASVASVASGASGASEEDPSRRSARTHRTQRTQDKQNYHEDGEDLGSAGLVPDLPFGID